MSAGSVYIESRYFVAMQLVTHLILLLDATENTFYESSSCSVLTPAPVDGDIFFERPNNFTRVIKFGCVYQMLDICFTATVSVLVVVGD